LQLNFAVKLGTKIDGEVHGYMDNEPIALFLQEAQVDECV